MTSKTVNKLFDIISYHQITEEEIYNSLGNIPIFSGNNSLKGYVDTARVSEKDLPCISYPQKGKLGNFYIKNEIFDANNTSILILKDKWKNKIDLNWFISQISPKVRKNCNSKQGVGYIGKEIMERIQIKIPDEDKQRQIGKIYREIKTFGEKISLQIHFLKKFVNSKRMIGNSLEIEKLNKIFHMHGGNSNLTKEFVYHNLPVTDDEKIIIYSGATTKNNSMGYISRNAKPSGNDLKIFEAPAIVVVRKGIAGHMSYITSGEFTINDDAYALIPKDNWKEKINMRWFVSQYQDLFYLIASKSDNGTFNKTYAGEHKIKVPNIKFQNEIAKELIQSDNLINSLEKLLDNVEKLLEYEII